LVLRRIIKVVAIRCQIFRLKCTKLDFGWGIHPRPCYGSLQPSPDALTGFKLPTSSKGRERREGKEGWRGKERGKGKAGEREGKSASPIPDS